jgi:hypothetical protein
MLSAAGKEPQVQPLGDLVLELLACVCRADRADVTRRTPLHALRVDSLTLVSVLSQVEAIRVITLTDTDIAAAFGAEDAGELIAVIERAAG